jgi:hypothetical protein
LPDTGFRKTCLKSIRDGLVAWINKVGFVLKKLCEVRMPGQVKKYHLDWVGFYFEEQLLTGWLELVLRLAYQSLGTLFHRFTQTCNTTGISPSQVGGLFLLCSHGLGSGDSYQVLREGAFTHLRG